MIGEDLTPFFVSGEFVADGDKLDGKPVSGIFDAAAVVSSGGIGMSDTRPVYTLPSQQVPAQPEGKRLMHGGKVYEVDLHEPDGTGVSRLILLEAM